MLARRTIGLARSGIRLLEQQGEGERARAIAEVLDAATGTAPAGEQYLTTDQVARALGVTTQTIHNWIKDGRLPAARLGGRTVVHRDSVLRTLEELEKARPKPPSQTKPDPARGRALPLHHLSASARQTGAPGSAPCEARGRRTHAARGAY